MPRWWLCQKCQELKSKEEIKLCMVWRTVSEETDRLEQPSCGLAHIVQGNRGQST
jgi:hypothetical protein